jgi:hypothetical protein
MPASAIHVRAVCRRPWRIDDVDEPSHGSDGSEQRDRDVFGPTDMRNRPTAMREMLRELPVFAGELSAFNVTGVQANPFALFTTWLHEAIEASAH